jgi:mannose-6-phosphate isomerase-like protein (cupin superfamily)
MSVKDFIELKNIPPTKDYKLAEEGFGFVVPGREFLASISPDEPINYIALLRYVKNHRRGNHYHKEKVECLTVLDGKIKAELSLVENATDHLDIEIMAGDMLTIKPGCYHTLIALTETAVVLEISPQKLDLTDQYT